MKKCGKSEPPEESKRDAIEEAVWVEEALKHA